MKKEYKFKGSSSGKSIVLLEDDKISITRKGFCAFLTYGLKGTKTINLDAITSIQLKKSGFAAGYIQFVLMGSQESKGGLQAALRDENTIAFVGKKYNNQASEIKNIIEESNLKKIKNQTNNVKLDDKYDKLNKIKKLLNDGVLNQEEFEVEKQKILQAE